MRIDLALSIEADGWAAVPDVEALIGRALDQAALSCGVALADNPEVSVLLCDDAAIRSLNAAWRGKDKATNVLSFPAASPLPLERRPMLGDIALAWETTAAEANHEGKPLTDHVTHLVVHGFLHLVGLDHEEDAQAAEMESLEVRVLADLGIADPYADLPLEPHLP